MKKSDIVLSNNLINLLGGLLEVAFSKDIEGDGLSLDDKEVIEGVMRYGSLTKIAEKRGVTRAVVSGQYKKILKKISAKIKRLDIANEQFSQQREERKLDKARIYALENAAKSNREEIKTLKEELNKIKKELARVTEQRDKAVNVARNFKLKEAQIRHNNNCYLEKTLSYKTKSNNRDK